MTVPRDTTEEFERHRRRLFGIGYRMTGSVADAEDLVQEAWIRWNRASGPVRDPGAYLARTLTRLALNRLSSAAARRESYVGPWLPEPLVVEEDTADRVERAEEVSLAMLVVLESLSPLERAAFVLHEVFGYPHRDVAVALGRSEASARQLASRARGQVAARRPRYATSAEQQRLLTEEFLAACAGRDLAGLMEMLAPDVTMWSDGGGKRRAALRPVRGAEKVARWLLGVSGRLDGMAPHRVAVNGQPGLAFAGPDGAEVETVVVVDFAPEGRRVAALRVVRNPEKLAHVRLR